MKEERYGRAAVSLNVCLNRYTLYIAVFSLKLTTLEYSQHVFSTLYDVTLPLTKKKTGIYIRVFIIYISWYDVVL